MDLPPRGFSSNAPAEPPPPVPTPAPAETPAPPPRRRRWVKWLIGIAAAGVLLVVLGVLLTPVLVNAFVRPAVVSTMKASLNGEPSIDRLSFSWFSGVEVEGIRIMNPPGFSEGPCVTVDRVAVDASLPALLGGKVVLKGPLQVSKPRVNVEQNAKGEINLALLAKPSSAAPAPAPAGPSSADLRLPHVEAALLVEDFVLTVKTPALAQPAAISPIRIESKIDTLDKPVTFAMKSADGSLDVKGSALVAKGGKLDIANVKAEVDYAIAPALLAPLKPALASFGPLRRFEGEIAGSGHIALDGLAKPSGKAELKLDLAEIGLELAEAPAAGATPEKGGAPLSGVAQSERGGAPSSAVAPVGAKAESPPGRGVRVFTLKPGAIQIACAFKLGADNVTDIDLTLTSPSASAAFKGQVTAKPETVAVGGDVTLSADVAEAANRFPGFIAADRKLQGRIVGGVKGLKAVVALNTPTPQVAVSADIDLRGEGFAEASGPILKDAAARFRVVVDTAKGSYRLEELDTHLDDLLTAKGFLRVERLVMPAAGQSMEVGALAASAALGADLVATADLSGLLAKARQLTDLIPKELAVAGKVDVRLAVPPPPAGQKVSPFSLKAGVKGLKVAGMAALEGIELPKDVAASAEGEVDLVGDWSVALKKAEVVSTLATLEANGSVRGLRKQPEGTLTLTAKAVTDALAAAIGKRLGDIGFSGSPVSISARAAGGAEAGSFEVFVTAPALDLKGLPGPAPRVEVREASLKVAGSGTAKWQKVAVTALQAGATLAPGADPAATAAGTTKAAPPAPSTVKLACVATADLAAGRYDATSIEASLPGATLTAAASIAMPPAKPGEPAPKLDTAVVKVTADVAGEVKPLLALARTWRLPVEDLEGTGSLVLRLEADGPLGKLAVRKERAEGRTIALAGKQVPKEIQWPITAAQEVSLVMNALDPAAPVEILSGSFVAPGIEVTTLKGRVDASGEKNDLEIAGSLDPAAVAAIVPGYLKGMTVASGPGPFALTLRRALMAPEVAAKLDLPETTLKGKDLPKDGVALGKTSADLQATLDLAKGTYALSRATLKTAIVTADAKATVEMDAKGGFARLEGQAQGTASLAKLREVAVAFGALTADTELTGDVKFNAVAQSAGKGAFPFTAEISMPGLHVKMPVKQEGKPPAVLALDEPQGAFTLDGTFANTDTGFTVTLGKKSELRFQLARGTLQGKVRSVAAAPAAAPAGGAKPAPAGTAPAKPAAPASMLIAEGLTADVTYDPARLNPILAAFESGEILAKEPQAVKLALNGPLLPGEDLRAWLAGFTCTGSLAFVGFANPTLKVEGPPFAVDLKDGKMPLDYSCKMNGGSVTAKGLMDTQGDTTRLTMAAREVAVNTNMAPMLSYLNPILNVGDKGSLDGVAGLELEAAWHGQLPLASPYAKEPQGLERLDKESVWIQSLVAKHATARGRFSAKNLKINGSPLLTDIVNTLMGGQSGEVGEIQPTDFSLQNGVFKYDNMVTRLGKMDLVFSGTIHVNKKMDMHVVAPVPKSLRQQNPSLEKYIGPTFVIPLRGKVNDPKLDYKEAVTLLLKEAGEAALKDKGVEKATDAIRGLLDRKKKK